MSTATVAERNPGIAPPHIGPAHHRRRNAWITVGALAVTVAMATSYSYWRKHDVVAADHLARFQAAYSERCDSALFSPPAAALAKKLYLRSSTLQRAIHDQLTSLESGAPCDAVYRALRAADFPMPSSAPPASRSATIDVPSRP